MADKSRLPTHAGPNEQRLAAGKEFQHSAIFDIKSPRHQSECFVQRPAGGVSPERFPGDLSQHRPETCVRLDFGFSPICDCGIGRSKGTH
jgi:hypothetical protein